MNENKIFATKRLLLLPLSIPNLKLCRKGRAVLEKKLGLNITAEQFDSTIGSAFSGPLEEMILKTESDPENYLWYTNWEIIHKKDNIIIGGAAFYGPPVRSKCAEIAYTIRNDYQACGFASEAVQKMILWAFENGAVEVYAETEKENIPSIKVCLKCGMNLKEEREETFLFSVCRE